MFIGLNVHRSIHRNVIYVYIMSMIVICIHCTFGVLEGAQRKRGNAVDIPPYRGGLFNFSVIVDSMKNPFMNLHVFW